MCLGMGAKVSERFKIIGIDCISCVYAIHGSLAKLKAVEDFNVDIPSGEGVVVYYESLASSSDIYRAIRDAGYDVYKESLVLVIDVEIEEIPKLENSLRRLIRGVLDCRASPVTKTVKILFNPYTVDRNSILSEIRKMGFSVKEISEEELVEPGNYGGKELLLKLTSFILGLVAVGYHVIGTLFFEPPLWGSKSLILGFIATTVLLLNRRILVNGFKVLFRGTPTMDSLVALSSSITYIFSLTSSLEFLPVHQEFFEASAGVLGFIAFGKYLEEKLRVRALQNLQKLLQMQQGRVRIVRGDKVEEVDVSKVEVGDVVEVKSGERILVDGVVVDGWGYVDESTFTGEPIPKLKTSKNRDYVLAGTILASGYIKVRVTRVGKETSLYHIYEAIKEAQFFKPSFQSFADNIVGILTWIVIALSLASFTYWLLAKGNLDMAILSAAAVLAVACPCPLGIAIPMVVSIASIKAVQLGLIVRSGTVFEKIISVDTAVLDKTGTITFGRPEVKNLIMFINSSKNGIMSYVCSIEKKSEHPLAKAILRYCEDRGIEVKGLESYEHIPGMGVVGSVEGRQIIVGSPKLLEEFDIDIGTARGIIEKIGGEGSTPICIAIDNKLIGLIEVSDKTKEEAIKAIEFLKSIGVKTIIASGDSSKTVKSIAKTVGVEEAYAELRPEDKAELIENLQKNKRKTMFVGDGINDAIAISKAFLGIAMGSGADISKEAGDIIITNNRLDTIIKLYNLSKKVKRKAIENLVWAFIYNITLIPIAIGFLYKPLGLTLKPEFGAIAMILSDISVILNSITLLKSN